MRNFSIWKMSRRIQGHFGRCRKWRDNFWKKFLASIPRNLVGQGSLVSQTQLLRTTTMDGVSWCGSDHLVIRTRIIFFPMCSLGGQDWGDIFYLIHLSAALDCIPHEGRHGFANSRTTSREPIIRKLLLNGKVNSYLWS